MVRQALQILLFGLCLQDCMGCRPGSLGTIRDANSILDGEIGPFLLSVPRLCNEEGVRPFKNSGPHVPGDDELLNLGRNLWIIRDLLDSGCSDILGRFMCTAYMPRFHPYRAGTKWTDLFLHPCREVCRDIWHECSVRARQLGIQRLPEFHCKQYPSRHRNESCVSHFYTPRDAPNIINATRLSPRRVSIFLSAPDPKSVTQAFLVRIAETWSRIQKVHVHDISSSPNGTGVHEIIVNNLMNPGNYTFEITAANDFGVGPKVRYHIPAYDDWNSYCIGCRPGSLETIRAANAILDGEIGLHLPSVPQLCEDEGILPFRDSLPYTFGEEDLLELGRSLWIVRDLLDSGCSDILGRFLCTAHLPRFHPYRAGSEWGDLFLWPCREVCRDVWRQCRKSARQLGIEKTPEFEWEIYPLRHRDECVSHLYPPRDPPNIISVTRHSPRRVSILLSAPDPSSVTQVFLIRIADTWSPFQKVHIHDISSSPNGTAVHEIIVNNLMNPGNYTFEITAANDFGVGPKVYYHIPAFDLNSWTCQAISVAVCPNVSSTALPDSPSLADEELADAMSRIEYYQWQTATGCHGKMLWFLCAVFLPGCSEGNGKQPYRETCEEIRTSCIDNLQVLGFRWPTDLDCQQFQSRGSVGSSNSVPTIQDGPPARRVSGKNRDKAN